MIVNILIGSALVGTLFVGLFTLRHLVKLRRELAEHHDSAAAPPTKEPADYRCAVLPKGVVYAPSRGDEPIRADAAELLDEGLLKDVHYNVHSGQFEASGSEPVNDYIKLYADNTVIAYEHKEDYRMSGNEAAKMLVDMYGKFVRYLSDPNGRYAEAVAMGAAALVYEREEVTQHCQYEQES